MSNVPSRTIASCVAYLAVATALFGVASVASADEVFKVETTVAIPGNPLVSFDISWVDSKIHAYFLADRSNKAIDVIDTRSNTVTHQFTPGFAGFTGNNDTSGPNGVLSFDNNGTVQVWAGDAPIASCTSTLAAMKSTECSTVKVLSYPSGSLLHNIGTGGQRRADELCHDPVDHLILIANDAEADIAGNAPFVSFIPTEGPNAYTVVRQISFPAATNGIEQCQWNPRDGRIYLNIPKVNGTGNDTTNGNVVVINPKTMTVEKTFSIPVARCAGPQGMAIGPDHQILLGCNAIYPFTSACSATVACPAGTVQNAAVIDERDGQIIKVLKNLGGADEVWFNPGDGHYFLADGSHLPNEQLGIVDSLSLEPDQAVAIGNAGSTTRRAHSVAADFFENEVYLPVPATGGAAAPPAGSPPLPGFTSTTCGALAATGCVAVFKAKHDDRPVFVRRGHDHDYDHE